MFTRWVGKRILTEGDKRRRDVPHEAPHMACFWILCRRWSKNKSTEIATARETEGNEPKGVPWSGEGGEATHGQEAAEPPGRSHTGRHQPYIHIGSIVTEEEGGRGSDIIRAEDILTEKYGYNAHGHHL